MLDSLEHDEQSFITSGQAVNLGSLFSAFVIHCQTNAIYAAFKMLPSHSSSDDIFGFYLPTNLKDRSYNNLLQLQVRIQ